MQPVEGYRRFICTSTRPYKTVFIAQTRVDGMHADRNETPAESSPYAKKHQTPIGGNEPKIQRGHGPEKKAVDRRDDRIPPQQVQRRLRGLEAVERHVGKRIMNRNSPRSDQQRVLTCQKNISYSARIERV